MLYFPFTLHPSVPQDDSLVGVPSKLNRYKRAGTKAEAAAAEEDEDDEEEDGNAGDKKKPRAAAAAASAIDNSLEDEEGEGDVGGGAGLTLIKIRLFKEVKKDEASPAN